MIKFNKYNVTDTVSKAKARVHYSLNNRTDGRECVTIYHKDYSDNLVKVFGERVIDNSDMITDYFEEGRVVLFKGDALYEPALARATS